MVRSPRRRDTACPDKPFIYKDDLGVLPCSRCGGPRRRHAAAHDENICLKFKTAHLAACLKFKDTPFQKVNAFISLKPCSIAGLYTRADGWVNRAGSRPSGNRCKETIYKGKNERHSTIEGRILESIKHTSLPPKLYFEILKRALSYRHPVRSAARAELAIMAALTVARSRRRIIRTSPFRRTVSIYSAKKMWSDDANPPSAIRR